MYQFKSAWNFYFQNWKNLLFLSIPLLAMLILSIYFILPKIFPIVDANQIDLLVEFFNRNAISFRVIDFFFDIVFIAFIGALGIQFNSITNINKPLNMITVYKKSYTKIVPLFLASFIANIAIGIALLLLIFPGIYLFARLALFPFYIVIDNEGPIKSLQSSWYSTDEYGGKLLGFTMLFFFLMMLAFSFTSAVFSFLGIFVVSILIYIEFIIFCITLNYLYFTLYESVKNM